MSVPKFKIPPLCSQMERNVAYQGTKEERDIQAPRHTGLAECEPAQ